MPACHHSIFLQARCSSCHLTVSKHWRQDLKQKHYYITSVQRPFFQDTRKVNHSGFYCCKRCGWQWHQLDHMQIICTSLQTDNHASISPLSLFHGPDVLPFQSRNQQHQSTEGISRNNMQKTSGYAMVVHGRPQTPKNTSFLGVTQPPGVAQTPYSRGHN